MIDLDNNLPGSFAIPGELIKNVIIDAICILLLEHQDSGTFMMCEKPLTLFASDNSWETSYNRWLGKE